MMKRLLSGVVLACASLAAHPALAHPHVYVTVETTVLFDKGTVTGLKQRWVFDEFYSGMAIEGLDTNNDGIYDRNELAELAKVNIDGLSQMNYFTTARLGEQQLGFDAPKDYFLEHVAMAAPPGPARLDPNSPPAAAAAPAPPAASTSFWSKVVGGLTGEAKPQEAQGPKVLVLEFVLPLKQPVLAEAESFEYAVSDPGFWIWFDLDTNKGAALGSGAPASCKVAVGVPKEDAATLQKLGEAFFQPGSQVGLGTAKSVSLSCPKS